LADALAQAWPAFALVAGLLLVGAVAARDGVFAAAGAALARIPGPPFALLASLLLLEAVVTAVLNLDTAVVFLTPVLLHAARRRGVGESAFLYGAVFMSNAASLLLPGANLTNLIVLAHERVAGATFAARLAPAWCVSVVLTIVFVGVVFRRGLATVHPVPDDVTPWHVGLGVAAIAAAATAVLVLSQPALPVLGLGVAAALAARLGARRMLDAVNPLLLAALLGVAVLLGALARATSIGDLVTHAGRWTTAWTAVLASVLVNNLPAAAMLSAHLPAHPRALLLGLDLGPNLAVTGSLSAVLWVRVARRNGAAPSVRLYSALGLMLVPLTVAASLAINAV
jgi:arsenical pump membrane protein